MIRTVWLVLLIVAGSQCSETAQKRILLSDPQYIQQELTRFQSELQELQVKLNAQERENADLKSTVAQLQTTVQTNKGAAVFTRWGRKDCSGNTSLVYTGYAGGSMYTDTGAAAEYLCMPSDPIWGPHKDLVYNSDLWVGYVYGAEYEDTGDGLFGFADNVHDVPCAVCLASQYTTSLMIPGRTECYSGWTEAYHGDLASGAHNAAAATQYVCVDQHPQSLEGGADKNENRKLFYGVKSKCGPLHCPPYEDDKFLPCVVCLK